MAPILWFEGRFEVAARVAQHNKGLLLIQLVGGDEGNDGNAVRAAEVKRLWELFDASHINRPYVAIQVNNLQSVRHTMAHIHAPQEPSPSVPVTLVYDCSPPFSFDSLEWTNDLSFDDFQNFILNALQKSNSPSSSQQMTASAPIASDQSIEDKVKKARELLEKKRKVDEMNKQKEDKEKELERIKTAKAMQQAQKDKDEKALLDAAAQRRRDKLEAEKERERVKALLQADKEEREYRERMRGGAVENTEQQQKKKEDVQLNKPVPSDRCRVQVRFPNGSSLIEEFPSSDNLHSLIELILQKKLASRGFKLSQSYPRRVFSEDEKGKTYLELGLTPTCTLIILQNPPKGELKPYDAASGLWLLLAYFLSPLQFIWTKILTFAGFGGGTSGSENRRDTAAGGERSNAAAAAAEGRSHVRGIPTGAAIRRRGNVARLHNSNGDEPEPDPDMANYNGNSTQFF